MSNLHDVETIVTVVDSETLKGGDVAIGMATINLTKTSTT